jgi:hypothetical protein
VDWLAIAISRWRNLWGLLPLTGHCGQHSMTSNFHERMHWLNFDLMDRSWQYQFSHVRRFLPLPTREKGGRTSLATRMIIGCYAVLWGSAARHPQPVARLGLGMGCRPQSLGVKVVLRAVQKSFDLTYRTTNAVLNSCPAIQLAWSSRIRFCNISAHIVNFDFALELSTSLCDQDSHSRK